MTSAKRIGSRWAWVPRLAGYHASFGVQPATVTDVLTRPYFCAGLFLPYVVRCDDGGRMYANDASLWPLGSIVRPGASA